MRRRSRSHTRSRRSTFPWWTRLAALVVVLAVAFGIGPAATAFTTGTVDRNSAVDVVSDPNAALAVDSAPAVHTNTTDPLVNATNHLDRDATVTVELREHSVDHGDLVVDGTNEGDRVSLTLAQAESVTVQIDVPGDGSLVGASVRFDVRASAPGLQVTSDNRSVPIEG